jgi:hypothetical protein
MATRFDISTFGEARPELSKIVNGPVLVADMRINWTMMTQ